MCFMRPRRNRISDDGSNFMVDSILCERGISFLDENISYYATCTSELEHCCQTHDTVRYD